LATGEASLTAIATKQAAITVKMILVYASVIDWALSLHCTGSEGFENSQWQSLRCSRTVFAIAKREGDVEREMFVTGPVGHDPPPLKETAP